MRRLLLPLFALSLLALPVQAETSTPKTKPPSTHLTTAQRFQQANTTHDGHLTEAQAKLGYSSIARHFAAIDQGRKGYVTEDDIRAYRKAQRALHLQSRLQPKT